MASSPLPGLAPGIHSRTLRINDLDMHLLEAAPPGNPDAPLVVLLHGFPELAYSWRKVIPRLVEAGYHVVAPDQRGYGRTQVVDSEGAVGYEDDLNPWRTTNLVKDIVTLVHTLGFTSVSAVVGHDSGSPIAGWCALIRPDVFKSVVMMSAPFTGPPAPKIPAPPPALDMPKAIGGLPTLSPPRKHYMLYYCTPTANADMLTAPEGLHAFFRAYYHVKSADWLPNGEPHPLEMSAAGLGELPRYYVMLKDETMPQAVISDAPSADEVATNEWLTESELGVYVSEYGRTGFQGGLNFYRTFFFNPAWGSDRELFAGKQIEVPALFISGKQDWGTFQFPGAVDVMKNKACKNMEDIVLIEGAGHWVQQEQSDKVVEQLLAFFRRHGN
ncbi:alpha/beta-hydrolase [Roridomyces roridus]|uniref:Alpha/beta-hydrolase n=1 Tax=Roridomyces roridus TaxID=1738132 RepID=A0AAD7BYU4_9AGAR|nr:alpha/beta-hydrolase [Roridomyces roridus]